MRELVAFLKEDLQHLFDDRGIDQSKYDANVKFEDPLTRYESLDGYLRNIQVREGGRSCRACGWCRRGTPGGGGGVLENLLLVSSV